MSRFSTFLFVFLVLVCLLIADAVQADPQYEVTPGLVLDTYTISRDDQYHEGWPMVCFDANGNLVCSYSMSDHHGGGPESIAMIRTSSDEGRTWSDPIVVDTLRQDLGEGFMNFRWVNCMPDGELVSWGDWSGPDGPTPPPGAPHNWPNDPDNVDGNKCVRLYRSSDNGQTWSGPENTDCLAVSLTVKQISNNKLILGGSHYHWEDDYWSQVVYMSDDNGHTFSNPITVLDDPNCSAAEGDLVEIDGSLVMYLRTRSTQVPVGAVKMISDDGGQTWEGPFSAGHYQIEGRVAAGRLSNGDVLVMHRMEEDDFRPLGYFIESPEAALSRIPYDADQFESLASTWGVIDRDSSVANRDQGYCGWVELPDGDVYAVNYITHDAPKPWIRGYRLSRSVLTPQTTLDIIDNGCPETGLHSYTLIAKGTGITTLSKFTIDGEVHQVFDSEGNQSEWLGNGIASTLEETDSYVIFGDYRLPDLGDENWDWEKYPEGPPDTITLEAINGEGNAGLGTLNNYDDSVTPIWDTYFKIGPPSGEETVELIHIVVPDGKGFAINLNLVTSENYNPNTGESFLTTYELSYTLPTLTPGDADGNGFVDADDAAILAQHWQQQSGATWAMGDFNRDGAVNDIDASLLAANWNSQTAIVPEPGMLILLSGMVLAGLLRWNTWFFLCFRQPLQAKKPSCTNHIPNEKFGRWVAVGTALTGGPPAQIRTCGITAYGSYLGCLA